jgi:Tol biopolymer transport system component
MDERQIFDRIHAALDVQPPPGAFNRLETALARAAVKPPRRSAIVLQWPRTGRRLAAALLVVVLATAAVGVYLVAHRALSQSVPAGPPPPRATIVFGRVNANGDEYIFTIHADGTGEKALVATPSGGVRWSHKGDRLLLAAFPSTNRVTTATVKADGSDDGALPLDSSLNLGPGAWSPDDSRIAFEGWDDGNPSLNGLYTADAADGGNRHRLTTTTGALHDIPISYSPDGSRILFWRGPSDTSQPGQLFLVDVDGSRLTQVSPPGMAVGVGFNGDPGGWSPDGAHISFAAFSSGAADTLPPGASGAGQSAVFVAAGDGTNAKQITDWGSWTTSAHWSPAGDWIVFDKINPAVNSHTFYLVHPDGSGTKIIPSLIGVCCAVWSPDGNRLLFGGGGDQGNLSDLSTVMLDGSHLTQLTHKPAVLTDIEWSAAT